MFHACTERTDLDELIGSEHWEGGQRPVFHYGPLALAMKQDEELVLGNSAVLSRVLQAKLHLLLDTLFIEDTNESIRCGSGFHLTLR